jgi:hypothetical protein
MVVELILTTLVTQAVGHYAQKGFGWFDNKTRELAEQAATGDESARQLVAARLADQLRELPMAGLPTGPESGKESGSTTSRSREQMVADIIFSPPPRDEGATEALSPRMVQFAAILDGTFRAVHELDGSMAAVPGWFHGQHCVSILDARARRGSWNPEIELWESSGGGELPYFRFQDVDGGRSVAASIVTEARTGYPRVTVIDCAGPEQVGDVLGRLRPELASIHNEKKRWSKPVVAEVAGVAADQVRSLLGVYEDRVRLSGPATDVRGSDEDVVSFINRPKEGELTVQLTGPAGVRAMKADLVQQVLAGVDRQTEWDDI